MSKHQNLVNQPGTISIGYNSLHFDDAFLRFGFWRNLLSPYTHQNQNGCGRADLLSMMIAYYFLDPDVLKWPLKDEKQCMKLEVLNEFNGLVNGRAHDAMTDVEIVVAIARRFGHNRRLWDELIRCFRKNVDQRRLETLPLFETPVGRFREAIILDVKYGTAKQFQAYALCVGKDSTENDLWLNLETRDFAQFMSGGSNQLKFVRRKAGDRRLVFDPSRFQLSEQRREQIEQAKSWILGHSDILIAALKQGEPEYDRPPAVDLDASLYLGGFPDFDNSECRAFHAADLEEKVHIASNWPDGDRKKLAVRVLCRNWSDAPSVRPFIKRFEKYIQMACGTPQGTLDFRGKAKLDWSSALTEINTVRNKGELDNEQLTILDELECWIQNKCEFAR